MMNNAPTVEQLVEKYKLLKPENAVVKMERQSADWRSDCVSPEITEVYDGQEVVHLSPKEGRIASIYCRVSSVGQRGLEHDDGYSIQHQLEYNIRAAIAAHASFRIYSDAGLSGFHMTADPKLQQEVRKARAEIYAEIYEEVMLKGAPAWNTPAQIEDMRTFLASRTVAILQGEKEELTKEKVIDRDSPRIEQVLVTRYQHSKGTRYRPALHALVEDMEGIHTIYLTDPDRLSRSQLLWRVLGDLLRKSGTQVITSSGEASWVTGQSIEAQLLAVIYPYEAERKLKDIKKGVMRGLVTMLRQGKPHSTIPYWLERDSKSGYLRIVKDAMPVLDVVLQMALAEDDHYGTDRIANALVEKGIPSPRGIVWHGDTVAYMIRNPLLYGCQYMFGREWPMKSADGVLYGSPFIAEEDRDPERPLALVTKRDYIRMHDRRQANRPSYIGRKAKEPRMMGGLLRCRCGYGMIYTLPLEKHHTPESYKCNSPTTERKARTDRGIVHTVLRPHEVNDFFADLVMTHFDLLLQRGPSRKQADLDEQTRLVEMEFAEEKRKAEENAKERLRGIPENTPAYRDTVESVIRALMGDQYKRYEDALRRIDRMKHARVIMTPTDQMRQQAQHFRELGAGEQNKLLKSLIRKVQVCGDPGSEYLEIVLHETDDEGNPITLPQVRMTTRVYKNGSLHRHLPTAAEYAMQTLFARVPPSVLDLGEQQSE